MTEEIVKGIVQELNLDSINIEECTPEEFIGILATINRRLRGISDKEEVFEPLMYAGSHQNPPQETRILIISNLLKTLKKIEDPKDKAVLCYYTVNMLHMFSNGNGRTSRFIYSYLNGQLDKMEELKLIHEDSESGDIDFETREGLPYLGYMDNLQAILLKEKYKDLSYFIDSKEYEAIRNGLLSGAAKEDFDVIFNDEAKSGLTKDEKRSILAIMSQYTDEGYSAGALAMLITLVNKGELQLWEKEQKPVYNEILRTTPFNFKYRKSELFESWSTLDFKNLIDQGNSLIVEGYNLMNEVFLDKTKTMPNSNKTYYEAIMGEEQKTNSSSK